MTLNETRYEEAIEILGREAWEEIVSAIEEQATDLVEEGEVAVIGTMNNPGTKLLTIADMSVVEAVMEVDETDVPTVKVGQRATVTIDAYPNKTFEGVVTEVGSSPMTPQAGQGTEAVNFEVKIQLTNPPAGVRPGFSASADIITGTRDQAIAIPLQALVVREKPAAPGARTARSRSSRSPRVSRATATSRSSRV